MKTNGSGALSFGSVSSALDDITTGDAASTLATSAGNITIDAQGNDTDIIFKGTDGSSDTTFLTIDGSDAGTLIANHNLELGTDASEILFGADNEVIRATRKTAYGDIGDQLDLLYKDIVANKLDTTGEWAKKIKAVKDANAKE